MKIIYIASGAANMYCGSCMHDNALAAGMKAAGEDVSLFPLYTPMRLDEESVGERQIFYGGIKAYLMQKYPRPFLGRDLLLRVAGSQAILRMMPRFDIGSAVDPEEIRRRLTAYLLGPILDAQREGMVRILGADPPFRGTRNASEEEERDWVELLRALGKFWELTLDKD